MNASAALAPAMMLACVLAPVAPVLAQQEPLHSLIDQHLAPVAGLAPERCSDAEFLRRASLDLIGMPPTSDEARAFLIDTAADKRQILIDRLFTSPHFARHLAVVLDVMLMERRAYTHVSADEWQAWLMKSVRENKAWNVLAREILQADGDDPAQRPPARFALDRASDPHVLTRDIGRVFFGRDMQCAQCHDHPMVPDYLQSDYHGLLAFVAPSYALVRTEGDKLTTLQAEKAGSDLAFESVFEGIPRRTGPRMPDGAAIEEPFFLPGDEYRVTPTDNVKPVPKFSRRAKLAELTTNGSNQAFNQNIVNRLWAHMFGRGLVHPPDMHHPENPAANPVLLRLLGERFVAMDFDIRAFLRELALSEAYQRSIELPDLKKGTGPFLQQPIAPADTPPKMDLSPFSAELQKRRAELKQAAEASAEAYATALEVWHEAEAALLPAAEALDAARNAYAEAKKNVDDATGALADAKSQLQSKQNVVEPVQRAVAAMRQAVAALPADVQLAATAETLRARAEELTAEAAALAKAFEEKTAAIGPPAEALGSAAPALGAALSKATPFDAAWKHAEHVMRSARNRASADAQALAAVDRRLATARHIAKLAELNQAVVAASEALHHREVDLVLAQKQLDDFAAGKKGTGPFLTAGVSLSLVAQNKPVPFFLDAAVAEHDRRAQTLDAASTALAAARADVAAKQTELDAAVSDMADRWAKDFTIASLKPLSPEQLCWTVLRVTGVYDRQWRAEAAELDQANPLTEEQQQDPAQLAAREAEIEQRTFDKLKGHVGTFVALYGAAAGQPQGDFFATADQALFAANAGAINGWIAPAEDNVTERVVKQDDPRAAAEELYVAVLTRLPSEEEIAEVAGHLTARAADKNIAAQELVWALLNSAEFRFNH